LLLWLVFLPIPIFQELSKLSLGILHLTWKDSPQFDNIYGVYQTYN